MDLYSFALNALVVLVGFSLAAAWVSARTARSKGYKFGWFFVFSLVSWFITAVVVVLIKPKGDKNAKGKLSSTLMLCLGAVIEFVGLSILPTPSATMTDTEVLELFASKAGLGPIAIALAGALVIVGAVANDYRQGQNIRTI